MQTILELRLREWTTPRSTISTPASSTSRRSISTICAKWWRKAIGRRSPRSTGRRNGPAQATSAFTRFARHRPRAARALYRCGACLVQAPPGMFVLDAQGKAVVTRRTGVVAHRRRVHPALPTPWDRRIMRSNGDGVQVFWSSDQADPQWGEDKIPIESAANGKLSHTA